MLDELEEYVEELIDEWPQWFLTYDPDSWDSQWLSRRSNTYPKLFREEWTINYDEASSKQSDMMIFWQF